MTRSLSSVVRAAALFVVLALAWVAPAQAAPSFPALSGRVVDDAQLLSPSQEAALTTKLEALETATTDQLVIVTVPDLQGDTIEDYGYQLGRHWQIGQAGKNNGVLLIVAPSERKVRIEVGYGLEGTLTDALSSVIIQERILPRFRDGDFPGGIEAGADAVIEQLTLDPAEAQQRVADAARASKGPRITADQIIFIIVLILIVGPIILAMLGIKGGGSGGGWSSGGSGWSSGGSSWSSGGGGGFSGGGGSFGGGGSSGGW